MSVDGLSNTFTPITLSGLTLTDSLNATYVPYSSANTTVNLNNQDLSNVNTITATTINANTGINTSSITATGISQFGNVKITPFTSLSGTILQYGVGGSPSTFSDRLLINNRSGTTVLYFNDSGDIIQYTGRFQTSSLLLTGLTNVFIYTDATGTAIGVQAIFSVGQTAAASPNILLAGGGAFQVSNTTNTQSYLAVQSTGVSSTLPIYGTAVVATGNPSLALGTTAMWMSVESSATGVLGAGLYGTNYYPMSYRGKTHQWQCDGVEKMTQSATNWNLVNCKANIYSGTRVAVPSGYMADGTLTLGSIGFSFGGGSGWNSNTAGLMFETNNNTEIQVHHSGVNVSSLMYYNGGNQQIYIGRDSGWGTKTLNIQGPLVCNDKTTINSDAQVNGNLGARGFILQGGGTYQAGCLYSDSNWGMILRGVVNGAITCFNFRNADGTELMSISASGLVGIGINAPLARLDVRGDMIVRGGDNSICIYGPNSSYNSYLLVGAGNGSNQGNSQTAVVKTTNGNLHLDAAHGYNMYLNYYVNAYTYATTYYFGGFAYGSDARYKENIITADNELCYQNIKKIRIVRYNFIKDSVFDRCTGNDKNRLGVLAQDLEKIYPNSVSETKDPDTNEPFKAVDTRQMYYTLVGCTQKLQETVEQQQVQIEQQQKQIDELKELVSALLKK